MKYRMCYVIIPIPNCSGYEGILVVAVFIFCFFCALTQSDAAMTAYVAVQVVAVSTGRWHSTIN